jgi:hypothetical protein
LLRIIIGRLLLAAVPFIIYFAWHAWLVRNGREPRVTPWGWLIAAGALLVALSLVATAVMTPSNMGRTYVPAETQPDGSVRPGNFK